MATPWDALIQRYTAQPAAPGGVSYGRAPRGGVDEGYIVDGLVRRGMPRHVAEGFVMNFRDESNLNPGINEIAPVVPGSRGGFGLAQWTGPRRRSLEAYAAQKGADVADPDLQLDFLMYELEGPERAAARSIFAAGNAGEAGAAIVRDFLRPAPQHRDRRAQRYLSSGGYSATARSADPARPKSFNRLWLDLGAS